MFFYLLLVSTFLFYFGTIQPKYQRLFIQYIIMNYSIYYFRKKINDITHFWIVRNI